MCLSKIKSFLWPSRGVFGIFLVWAAFLLLNVLLSLGEISAYSSEQLAYFTGAIAVNLVIFFILSCISAWAYEKMKAKEKRSPRTRR